MRPKTRSAPGSKKARAGPASGWLALFTLVAGCSAAETGIPRLEAPAALIELDLRVGSVDDPETSLTQFSHLQVAPDGRIYTMHRREAEVRVHAVDGTPLGTIGRRGDGPGEFSRPSSMGLIGDTLWVLDGGAFRFSLFSLDGKLLRDFTVPIDFGTGEETRDPSRPEALLSDGSLLGKPPAWCDAVADGTLTRNFYASLDAAGRVRDTLAWYPLRHASLAINHDAGGSACGRQPYSDTEIVWVSRHRPEILRVDRTAATGSDPATMTLTRLGFDGDTLLSRAYSYDPIPLDPALPDSVARDFARRIAEMMSGAEGPILQAAREAIFAPAFWSPVTAMESGSDGSIWLRRENTGGNDVEWLILDRDGNLMASVSLPEGLDLQAVDRDTAWGMELDGLDVPYLVRYRVTTG